MADTTPEDDREVGYTHEPLPYESDKLIVKH